MERIEAIRSQVNDLQESINYPGADWEDFRTAARASLEINRLLLAIAEASLALYRAEQAYQPYKGNWFPCPPSHFKDVDARGLRVAAEEARAAWNAACAKWEAGG